MQGTIAEPPPITPFKADEFRRWLAGMVSEQKPPDKTDRGNMKAALVRFLSCVPLVFNLERLTLWEKIGNAASSALDSCNNDLIVWANLILEAVDAQSGAVAACDELRNAIDGLDQSDWWQAECLRVYRELRFVLPAQAREAWTLSLEAKKKGGGNGSL